MSAEEGHGESESKKIARSQFIVVISLHSAQWGHGLWVKIKYLSFSSHISRRILTAVCSEHLVNMCISTWVARCGF
jgi:hypothetical protein